MRASQRATLFCCILLALAGCARAARIAEGFIAQPSHQQNSISQGLVAGVGADVVTSHGLGQASQEQHAAFGDYYYQDELAAPVHPEGGISTEQRRAYVVEDATGRISVVEHESRELPGGGHMTWQRTTGPGSLSVTALSTSRGSDSSSSSWDLVNQLSNNVLGAGALASLNDLLDAFDAQQQRVSSMMMRRYVEAAAAASQQLASTVAAQPRSLPVKPHMPCPRHQAMMAAAAAAAAAAAEKRSEAAAAAAQQQQPLQEQALDFAEQFAQQQLADLEQMGQQEKLQQILAENGLALSQAGSVIPLEEALQTEDLQTPPEHPELDDLYLEYADFSSDAAAAAAGDLDTLYDTNDSDYVIYAADDAIPPPSSKGDLNSLWRDSEMKLDFALLVLLVACTAGMCVAFLHSLLQLRAVLHAQEQQGPATGVAFAGAAPVCLAAAVAAAAAGCCGRQQEQQSDDGDDLTLPLLLSSEEAGCAQEQQPAAVAAGPSVQRFYNPLCYQPLPGDM